MADLFSTATGPGKASDDLRNIYIWEPDGKFRIRHQNPKNAIRLEANQTENLLGTLSVRCPLEPIGQPWTNREGGDDGKNGRRPAP